MSTPLPNLSWPRLPDGHVFPTSSRLPEPQRTAQRLVVREAVERGMTTDQLAMVLGTLLGDGSLFKSGRYVARHGMPQANYLWAKYTVLSEFVPGVPSVSKKNKSGYPSRVFWTAATPELASWRARLYPEGVKTVSREWIDAMDRLGFLRCAAWWVADDGSRIQNGRSCNLQICTHGFTPAGVLLLIDWMSRHGYQANLYTVKRNRRDGTPAEYPTIMVSNESTHRLMADLTPWTPPSMHYKLTPTDRIVEMTCMFCGNKYTPGQDRLFIKTSPRPCCGNRECRLARKRHETATYMADPAKRAELRRRRREQLANNDELRARVYAGNREWMANHPEKQKEYTNRYRAKKKAEKMAVVWTCAMCGTTEPLGAGKCSRKVCKTCRPKVMCLHARIRYFRTRAETLTDATGREEAKSKVAELTALLPI